MPAGLEEVDAFEIGLAVAGFYQDAFGREPRIGVAGRSDGCGSLKGDVGEVRYAAHGDPL